MIAVRLSTGEDMDDISAFRAQMTLEEKASLCSGLDFWHFKGIERLGIPAIMVTDGPHGLRKQVGDSSQINLDNSVPATCFPTASALAATWNRELLRQVGQAMGEECRAEKVGVILGPGANIKRSPLCGRNFEYFSEDPYLSGEMARSHINGIQSAGIGASLKHYAANNQESRRMVIDAVVDERALREIYLAGFEIAVKGARPRTVMSAYNRVNGSYCSENQVLLNEILRDEWGYEGLVLTDWGAMNDRVAGLEAGVDVEMPGPNPGNDAQIVQAVQSGQLDEAVLDRAVERILRLILQAAGTLARDDSYDRGAHHTLARWAAAEGSVLLKNDGGLLPLSVDSKVALIGRFAREPRYQGAGSSLITPTRLDTLYGEVAALIGEENLFFAPGYTAAGDVADENLIAEALAVAETADVVIIHAGLPAIYEIEALDRSHLNLPPGHDALIAALTAAHPKVVVVLSNGAPMAMPWAQDVPAILEGYLGGQAGAGALADILFGKTNPSGKLAETFPLRLEDTPCYHYFPGGPMTVEYRESIYVGYRYYDTAGQDVLFPFGHGLSYTTFEYSELRLGQEKISDSELLAVSVQVRNTGAVAGQEIVQLYVRDVESSFFRPDKELKGFAKVALQPGEEATVTMKLDRHAFAYYDMGISAWAVETGIFEILVGASSVDIRLQGEIEVTSSRPAVSAEAVSAPEVYSNFPKGKPVSREDFAALLQRPLPPNERARKGRYTVNTPIGDMSDSFVGRRLYGLLNRQMEGMIDGLGETPTTHVMRATIREAPLRFMMMTSNGAITPAVLEAVLKLTNGRYVGGLGSLLKAIFWK